jgi:hypothetical protein
MEDHVVLIEFGVFLISEVQASKAIKEKRDVILFRLLLFLSAY